MPAPASVSMLLCARAALSMLSRDQLALLTSAVSRKASRGTTSLRGDVRKSLYVVIIGRLKV